MPPPKVLIVDDELPVVSALQFLMEQEGYQVMVAYDGEEALDIMFKTKPDLILLDIMLPVIDGYEVCEVCRLNPELNDVKIIFLSAKGTDVDVAKGLFLGADAYITKPFSNIEIIDKVKELVGPCN